MSTPIPPDLPTYIENDNQENYHAEFNQTAQQWLSSAGNGITNQTTANITILAANAPRGTMWFNTDLQKLQVRTAGGVETVTSV